MAENICPPLGSGSVDARALHEAACKGENLTEAVASATTRKAVSITLSDDAQEGVNVVVAEVDDFTLTDRGNGWFLITGPNDLSEKLHGEDSATARLEELVEAAGADSDS
ncbi:hypothetical protein GRI39_01970 [Altererythrobacter indicus]|uniref:Uncharacterized protein n=1 Tax=Altericroceibacterium indicum TaxID=374177 RepID=A0A845A6C3_9SPHN|nr:hypothetical protein [Altericroceibacterium indicum]MXP24813.1 hypothetical protein [Altericroceibacterium indicum]